MVSVCSDRTFEAVKTWKNSQTSNRIICAVERLLFYIEQTETLVSSDETVLFITHAKPHKKPSKNTKRSGLGTSIYTSHRNRHVSLPKAVSYGTNLNFVLSKVGWSSDSVSRKHYNLSINSVCVPVRHVNSISATFHIICLLLYKHKSCLSISHCVFFQISREYFIKSVSIKESPANTILKLKWL